MYAYKNVYFYLPGAWEKSVMMATFWAEMAAQGHASWRKASTVQVGWGAPPRLMSYFCRCLCVVLPLAFDIL